MRSYQTTEGRVTVAIESDDILLDTNLAVPCGLLINELISNAFKHAFPSGPNGYGARRNAVRGFTVPVGCPG